MARRNRAGRTGVRRATPILILTTWAMLAGAARAQSPGPGTGGYMRVITSHGQMAGESTDPNYDGWIPLRHTTMPSPTELAAMVAEDPATAAKAVHPPIVVVKDRDKSSLGILGAFSSRQRFPEIDITVTDNSDRPAMRYKLTDATIIAIRAGGSGDGTQVPMEQLRISYAKIEVLQ
jgi:type VI protein secretion system component Hcp